LTGPVIGHGRRVDNGIERNVPRRVAQNVPGFDLSLLDRAPGFCAQPFILEQDGNAVRRDSASSIDSALG
jgi:hypothetical protein